jgi:hypothetical protein
VYDEVAMNASLRIVSAAFLIGALVASVGGSQGSSPSTIRSCSEAARFVQNRRPAHKQFAALNYLLECGSTGAAATIVALEQTRDESDLTVLAEFYLLMRSWRDAALLQASLKLALDPTAKSAARVHTIGYLLELAHPGRIYGYDALVDGVRSAHMPCVRGLANHSRGASVGETLPPDFTTQIETSMRALVGTVATPTEVRNAASCADF